LLTEVICTRSNREIELMKGAWDGKKTLIERVEGEIKGSYEELLVAILNGSRAPNGPPNEDAAKLDAEALNRLLRDDKKEAKAKFVEVFSTRSWVQIRTISGMFQDIAKKYTMAGAIDKAFGDGDTGKALLTIQEFSCQPYDFWAKKLVKAMKGMGSDDGAMRRINRMLSCHHFVHSFTESTDFQPLKNLFKIPNEVEPSMSSDGIMTLMDGDDLSDICIEQTAITELGTDWMQTRGYNEGFDVIFDECALDNIVEDEYVQTTIYGHCLKTGGVVYVSDKRMTGDTRGRKLRSKMKALYPNSHFRLIAERDTAWFTQFVFLKASDCSGNNPDSASSTKSE